MKVVLHICCGVCAAGVAERLMAESHEVLGYFYNPNIHPAEEYEKRLAVARRVAQELDFPLVVGPCEPGTWLQATKSLASEPEGGRRCEVCYRLRLQKTYSYLLDSGADAFTTTLTISPHKSAVVVNRIGVEIGGSKFLARDFKKKAGFQRANELAKQLALYRQDYCGCIYSMRKENPKH
ncbi:MAG: epoxyqueuosine reductase QueH [Chloroflexota bacterium]